MKRVFSTCKIFLAEKGLEASKTSQRTTPVQITFKAVPYNSEGYKKCLDLRYRVLRKPEGLEFDPKKLAKDAKDNYVHILGCLPDGRHVCTAIIVFDLEAKKAQIKQVAVIQDCQGLGIGHFLDKELVRRCKEKGIKLMFCDARATARRYYERTGYSVKGGHYYIIGIKHWYMEKSI